MLTLISQNIVINQDEYYVKHLSSGLDELSFPISIYDPVYQYIKEEEQIRDRDEQTYLVKSIDAGKTVARVKCQLDIDAWKSSMYLNYSNGGNKTVYQTINNTISGVRVRPSDWSVTDSSGSSIGRTVEAEGATALEILDLCRDIYNVTFRFDNKAKTITILSADPSPASKGLYAARDLNLKEINYKGKSTSFATRIYPYGKDGMDIKSENAGVEYLENNTYSNKTVSVYWKDERYTIAANLKAAAQAKLSKIAVPQSSYACSVVDLAKALPNEYGWLDFQLFDKITLLDDIRGTSVDHIIVEYQEYPYYPEQNVVTLSSITPRIQSQVKTLEFDLNNVNSVHNVNQAIATDSKVKTATDWITGGNGGWVFLHKDSSGRPDELIISNKQDYTANDAHVWRWNSGGLGYSSTGYNGTYGTAITAGGEIVADFVKTGALNANLITTGSINANLITTGTINADLIKTGTISNTSGTVAIDLTGNTFDIKNSSNQTVFSVGQSGVNMSSFNVNQYALSSSSLTVNNNYSGNGRVTFGTYGWIQSIQNVGIELGTNTMARLEAPAVEMGSGHIFGVYNNYGASNLYGIYMVLSSGSGTPIVAGGDGKLYWDTSSIRYKTDVQDLTDEDYDFDAIAPKSFIQDGKKRLGMIAEDIEQSVPTSVFYREINGHQIPDAIKYDQLIPILVREVQMLKKRVEELENAAEINTN